MSRATHLANNLYEQRHETGDVTFIVQSERIPAHRNVLAALSEKYKAQFYGPQPDQGDIQVNGVTAAAFKQFIELFYSDEVKLSIEHIGDVLDLAKQSLVDDFVNECIEFLKRNVATDNVCSIYRLAIAYDLKELKDLCEEKISSDTKALFATEEFVHCDREMFERILKMDSFSCPEGEVFDACIAWARAICVEKYIDGSNSANLRGALGEAIFQVRFASMTLEEFVVRQKSLEGFFTFEETNEIMYIIGKLNGFQSQKFNQMRRIQSEPVNQALNLLKCHRNIRELPGSAVFNQDEVFGFLCKQNIRLYGFVVAYEINTGVARFAKDISMPSFSVFTNIPIRIEKSNNHETVVYYVNPVKVIAHKSYWIHFASSDLNGRLIYHTYQNDTRIVKSNNITFSFFSDKQYSLVSRLLFTVD